MSQVAGRALGSIDCHGATSVAAVRHEAVVQVHHERFDRAHFYLGIPLAAAQEWKDISDYPLQFAILYMSGTLLIAVPMFLSGWLGFKHQDVASFFQAAVPVPAGVCLLAGLVWRVGPLSHRRPCFGIFMKVMYTLIVLLGLLAIITGVLKPLEEHAFNSRFMTLLTTTVSTFGLLLMLLLTILSKERGPSSTPVQSIMFRAALRTLRIMDTMSDAMYARILWEKVCSSLYSPGKHMCLP